MKALLLLTIRLYWAVFPKEKRRKCLFKISCSHHVFEVTKNEGFNKGIVALKYRFSNCRSGYHLFKNPTDGRLMMILPNAKLITEEEISERFIK